MALTISGTSNGKLGNLSLSANTGDILDSANTTFFGVDLWYITANINASGTVVTMNTNWARLADTAVTNASNPSFTYSSNMTGSIGSGMTESSGVFTFPSTGIWHIDWRCAVVNTSASDDFYYPFIVLSTDNFSTEGSQILGTDNVRASTRTAGQRVNCVFDVQDTSNYKCRFEVGSLSTGYARGGTNYMENYVMFMRLGDT